MSRDLSELEQTIRSAEGKLQYAQHVCDWNPESALKDLDAARELIDKARRMCAERLPNQTVRES